LVIYSGRNEELVGPIIETFEEESGIDVEVRYGDTAELAATILEEGENSPADVFFAQDAGALGAVSDEGLLSPLPEEDLNRVEERFRDPNGGWVGVSGRARVVAYNTETLSEQDLPESILDFTDPEWEGRIGWAPTNGSFQAFVTALRLIEGEDTARDWLEGIEANDPRVYDNNLAILEGVASGEIEVGFVNHYYLFPKLQEEGEGFPVRNYYLKNGDPGALINVAGIGILNTAGNSPEAEEFLKFMLSEEAQQYFADETFEYPLIEGVAPGAELVPLSEIEAPEINLGNLDDLQGTLDLLRGTGVL
jgi:iron(III) transport system substrate-binding protein